MLKVFEAFAGYGSQRMALRNLGIEHEVVAISEFDKYADASYQAIHGETWNMGDITKIDVNDVPEHDLFTYSFPCQDISVAGKGKGFSKDSGTRSGLLWESERIIKAKKPKYLLMENVKNLISEKFMPGFAEWILVLEELGYSNYYEVLNAKDFGIPQNRERVFMVSILGEHEPYVFPKPIKLEKRLKDVLEDEVDEKYYLDNERAQQLVATITDVKDIEPEIRQVGNTTPNPKRENPQTGRTYDTDGLAPTLNTMQGGNRQPQIIEPKIAALEGIPIKNNTDQGYLIAKEGDGVDLAYPTSNTRRGRVQKSMAQTLTTDDSKGVVELTAKERFGRMGEQAVRTQNKLRLPHGETLNPWNEEQSSTNGVAPTLTTRPEGFKTAINVTDQYRIRKLTPLECFRLMVVTDEDFYKAQAVNSNTQLYKQAGNSIVVSVLEAIFRNMFLEVPEKDLIGEHISLF